VNVHYRVRKGLPPDLLLSHLNLVHSVTHYILKTDFSSLFSSPSAGLLSGLSPSDFLIYDLFMSATCPVHVILFLFDDPSNVW
jgi:hypothetical protein